MIFRDISPAPIRECANRIKLTKQNLVNAVRKLGTIEGCRYLAISRLVERLPRCMRVSRTYNLYPRICQYPLMCRSDSSDFLSFKQVFLDPAYSAFDKCKNVELVIDCGAYVGYSSAYFLSKFPHCQVVAVEPVPSNFQKAKLNLQPYGKRVRLMEAGIWSHPCDLVISETKFRDGQDWARQLKPCNSGDRPTVRGIDIETILRESGRDRISILKMDIEGAESIVFSSNYEAWINRVDTIAIELHNDSHCRNASTVFFNAIHNQDFNVARAGELTFCWRP